ncbi:MAG: hypothetical protein ACI865_000379 [Flavobacteriaceae bacterium]|jgi:hypothetical protein
MKKLMIFSLILCTSPAFGQTSENEIEGVDKKRELAAYEVLVSPNPSSDKVYINAPVGSICKVVSAAGTIVGTWEVREHGIDLDDLGLGSYIAFITFNGQTIHRRFVII